MRRLTRTVPAPADLGIPVMGVPQGSDIELDLRLEAVMEGVLVSGRALGRTVGECVRCLDPVEQEFDVEFQELYAYSDRDHGGHGRRGGRGGRGKDDEEEVELHLEGDLIALESVLRDAVVLTLPLQPVCRDDCPGLCPDCGQRLADDPEHGHESADPRWAALHELTQQGSLDEKRES
jgi:uncharacterized protein